MHGEKFFHEWIRYVTGGTCRAVRALHRPEIERVPRIVARIPLSLRGESDALPRPPRAGRIEHVHLHVIRAPHDVLPLLDARISGHTVCSVLVVDAYFFCDAAMSV